MIIDFREKDILKYCIEQLNGRDIEIKTEQNYHETFDSALLSKLQKILGLTQNVKVYTLESNPIKFDMNIGSLGTIVIFIKSREIIEHEISDEIIE